MPEGDASNKTAGAPDPPDINGVGYFTGADDGVPLRLGILISGRGSNMEAILRACKRGRIRAEPAVVISSNPGALGIARAKNMGVPARVVPSIGFEGTRDQYDALLAEELKKFGVTPRQGLVCLAGFMRVLGPQFVSLYRNRVLNVHPALLPAFPGLQAQRQAVEYGARVSGCTVHIVDEGTDTGPVVAQAAVYASQDDTAESLSARILRAEHRIYPEAVALFAEGRVRVRGRRVKILPARTRSAAAARPSGK